MKKENGVRVHGNINCFEHWAKLCAVVTIFVLIGVAALSLTASAASTATKPDLGGYTGPDAQYVASQIPEPVIKPGFKYKVGYLAPFAGINELFAIQKACEKKTQALCGTFIAYDAGLDIQKQVSQMDQLISQKVDLIIAYPVTEAGLTQGMAAAKKAGIKVLMLNVPASAEIPVDPNADAMVGMAFDLHDYATMKYIAQKYPHGKVAFLGFGPPAENLIHIVGRGKYWAKELGLNILGQVDALDASPNAATVATQAIMGKYPDVQVIFGYNSYATMAAASALRAAGKTNVMVATMNGGADITVSGLKSGSVAVVYRNPWEKVGDAAAIAAYDILTKQNLPAKRMLFTGEVASKDNVDKLTFVH
jgi:ribose transport system substrate-binding protein